jgi:putative nucleotidyltransferase with HDIG domain
MKKPNLLTDGFRIRSLLKGKSPKKGDREAISMGKNFKLRVKWFRPEMQRWLTLIALSLIISILLFPNILREPPKYNLGDVAERDIKASRDFLIEKKELTEERRQEAVKNVQSVYDFDITASDLIPRLKEAFSGIRGYYPYYAQAEDIALWEFYNISEKIAKDSSEEEGLLRDRFFKILEIPSDEDMFQKFRANGFSSQVEEEIIQLVTPLFKEGIAGNRIMLMDQIEKGIILHDILTQKETSVTDLKRFYDIEGAKNFLENQRSILEKRLTSPELAELSIRMGVSFIKPNLTFNQRETELRKDLARKTIKPFYFKIKKGEMLVREGERIEPDHLLKLSGEASSFGQADILGRAPATAILIGLLFSAVYLVGLMNVKSFSGDGRDLLFNSVILLMMFTAVLAYNFVAEEIARGFHFFTSRTLLFAMPVACGAMLIAIFQGLGMAVTFSLIISVLASLIIDGRVEFFIYFFISSLVAAYGVRDFKERGVLIKTGLKVGLINIVLSLSIEMIYGTFNTTEVIIASAAGFIGGMLVGVISTGIIPLIEMSFGFTTDMKLLELANLDQPLLRELMVQTPGTYHHSVIVSNMVEATAKAIQASPLLAKVSAYYHDIGKMRKPLYFIENQRAGENRHEKLAPSMSSLVLISHVKDGVELAKKHKLGREIIDIIQQHHGTSLISYFYQKAKEHIVNKGAKSIPIKEEDFRYPGQKPQTKEAGLVMLADMVEAASRSLVDPNPARIQGIVQKIINKVFSDGQLDECELTLKDLHEIAKSFNNTLSGIFHQRVEYPEVISKIPKKAVNGDTDQITKEDTRVKKSEDKPIDEKGLKRLGL